MEVEYVTADTPVGTRVVFVGDDPAIKNKEGTVIAQQDDGFLVEFDEAIPGGHDGNGLGGKWGHCWWFLHEDSGVVVIESAEITDEAINELLFGGTGV